MLAVNVRGVVVAIQATAAHMGKAVASLPSAAHCRANRLPGASIYSMTRVRRFAGARRGSISRRAALRSTTSSPAHGDRHDVGHGGDGKPLIRSAHGQHAEIAAMVAYLVGPESGFVTGAA